MSAIASGSSFRCGYARSTTRTSPAQLCPTASLTSSSRSRTGLRQLSPASVQLGQHPLPGLASSKPSARPSLVHASPEGGGGTKAAEFGYSRKDIILIGFGIIALGYALYYGLQAMGLDAGIAGNWVQLIIFIAISVGWVGSYIFRVATKQMTYVKQLEQYEDAVMRKRVEEMTDQELQTMLGETEATNADNQAKQLARQQQRELEGKQ